MTETKIMNITTQMKLGALGLTATACVLTLLALNRSGSCDSSGREDVRNEVSHSPKGWRPAVPESALLAKPTKHRTRDKSPSDEAVSRLLRREPETADTKSRLQAVAPEDRDRLGRMLADAVTTEDEADDKEVMRELHRLSIEHSATAAAEKPF